jgi:hypothetical protein
MDIHALLYVAIALVYLEASIHHFYLGRLAQGCREIATSTLYTSIALLLFDPTILEGTASVAAITT